jgi:hypothetical protein
MPTAAEEIRRAGIEKIAQPYFKLLSTIDWTDRVLLSGLAEGLNKFLSNAHLASFHGHKHHKTHFVSPAALAKLEQRDYDGLVWEHLVPKRKYIQQPCEQHASKGTLTADFIRDRLRRFWYLASITTEENLLLHPTSMRVDWNETNVLDRYEVAKVALRPNPFFGRLRDDRPST